MTERGPSQAIKNRWLGTEGITGIITRKSTVHVVLPRSRWSSRQENILRYTTTRILWATYG